MTAPVALWQCVACGHTLMMDDCETLEDVRLMGVHVMDHTWAHLEGAL